MGKATGKKQISFATAAPAALPPVIAQAQITEAQAARFVHAVATVPNPYGEVTVKGEIRTHKACRRVAQFETLHRSGVIDRAQFVVLEWYSDRLSLASAGLFKSCLSNAGGGGGGSAISHKPSSIASVDARADIEWSRRFIRPGLLPAFDGVMVDEDSFAAIGRRLYTDLSEDTAKRRISAQFKAAVAMLSKGVGGLIKLGSAA